MGLIEAVVFINRVGHNCNTLNFIKLAGWPVRLIMRQRKKLSFWNVSHMDDHVTWLRRSGLNESVWLLICLVFMLDKFASSQIILDRWIAIRFPFLFSIDPASRTSSCARLPVHLTSSCFVFGHRPSSFLRGCCLRLAAIHCLPGCRHHLLDQHVCKSLLPLLVFPLDLHQCCCLLTCCRVSSTAASVAWPEVLLLEG